MKKKPSLYELKMRHAQHYLQVTFAAGDLFDEEKTQTQGLTFFDKERQQIDFALAWVRQQPPSIDTDAWLIQFVDAISSIGMLRYQIAQELIPLVEQQVLAIQRWTLKEEESDAIDSIGILYAYLGYYEIAVDYFKKALGIVRQTENHDLEIDIVTHMELAQQQLKEQRKHRGTDQIPNQSSANEKLKKFSDWERQLSIVRTNNDLLSEADILRKLAEAYEAENNYDKAAEYQEQALAISQNMKLRYGEIDSRISLALNYFSKPDTLSDEELQEIATFIESAGKLAAEDEFAWGLDLSILNLFFEMAPIMRQLESIADFLETQKDSRAKKIYQTLDTINTQTSNITLATQRDLELKLQLLPEILEKVSQEIQKAHKLLQS